MYSGSLAPEVAWTHCARLMCGCGSSASTAEHTEGKKGGSEVGRLDENAGRVEI